MGIFETRGKIKDIEDARNIAEKIGGIFKGFNKNNSRIVVDFSNGENIPNMINVIDINKVKKVEM